MNSISLADFKLDAAVAAEAEYHYSPRSRPVAEEDEEMFQLPPELQGSGYQEATNPLQHSTSVQESEISLDDLRRPSVMTRLAR
jgi:hypothetical protein